MNVVLVTGQLVEVKDGRCLCIENFKDILLRFAKLGTLTLCCREYDGTNSHNTVDCDITAIVPPARIHFLKREYGLPSPSNTKIFNEVLNKADLVIGYMPSRVCERVAGKAHKRGKKFMAYLVGCTWDSLWNHSFKGKLAAIPFFLSTRWAMKHADYALYVTEQFLQHRYPTEGLSIGCSDVRIPKLSNSVLQNRIKHINDTVKNDRSTINIVTVAAIDVRYKGQQYVIKALAQLKAMGNCRFHYYLIGGGDRSYLENLAKKYGVDSQVHIVGKVPHSKIFDTLDGMHVYIQPSLQEGLPRSVVEAMSRGLLCIGSKTAAMPDMLDPKYIVRRKSVGDITRLLAGMTKEDLIEQANRNFNEAKLYQEDVLDKRRDDFFESVKADMARHKN